MVEGVVEREEYGEAERVVVVTISDPDWEEEVHRRIRVPMEATKSEVEQIVQSEVESIALSKELSSRVSELQEKNADCQGVSKSPRFNPKRRADEMIEFSQLREKKASGNLKGQEQTRFNELKDKHKEAGA